MKRRAFLTSTIGVVAGCTGRPGESGSPRTTTTTSSSGTNGTATTTPRSSRGSVTSSQPTSPTFKRPRTLSVTSISQRNLGNFGITADAKLVNETVTKDQPPRIKPILSTSSSQPIHMVRPIKAYSDGHTASFKPSNGAHEFLALTTQKPTQKRLKNGCWTSSVQTLGAPPWANTKSATITASSPYTRTYWIYNSSGSGESLDGVGFDR